MATDTWDMDAVIQLLLWPESWLDALVVDAPPRPARVRRAAPASLPVEQAPLPLDAPQHVIDAAFIGRKIKALRNWRAGVQREYEDAGKPAQIKQLLDMIDTKTNTLVLRLWALWGTQEQPAWKKAS